VVADVKVVVPAVFMMLGKTWAKAPVVIVPPLLVRAPPAAIVSIPVVMANVAPLLTVTLAAVPAESIVTVAAQMVVASPTEGIVESVAVPQAVGAQTAVVVQGPPAATEKRAVAITCPLATSSKRARTKEEKRDIIRTSEIKLEKKTVSF
jgi:hypothetical protein